MRHLSFVLIFVFCFSNISALQASALDDQPLVRRLTLENLPPEVLFYISQYLPAVDIARLRGVNRFWRDLLSKGDFAHSVSVTLKGQKHKGIKHLLSPNPRSAYTPSPCASLGLIRRVHLTGPYPGHHADPVLQEAAAHKMDAVCHPKLEVLSWRRSSRIIKLDALTPWLSQIYQLTSLTLQGGVLKDVNVKPLWSIKALTFLQHLDLSQNTLTQQMLRDLLGAPCRKTLKALHLDNNQIGGASPTPDGPVQSLLGFPALEILTLVGNDLNEEDGVSALFAPCPHLATLNLGNNPLRSEGITRWLALSERWQDLNLRKTHLTELAPFNVPGCAHLISLVLKNNPLALDVARFEYLAFRETLRRLDMRATTLTDESLGHVVAHAWPCLARLDLGNNALGNEGAQILARTQNMPCLKVLSLVHARMSWDSLKDLIVHKAPTLEALDIRQNHVTPIVLGDFLKIFEPALETRFLPAPLVIEEISPEFPYVSYPVSRRKKRGQYLPEPVTSVIQPHRPLASSSNAFSVLEEEY